MKVRRRYLAGGAALLAVVIVASAVGLLLSWGAGSSSGGNAASASDPVVSQYAAKFICGTLQGFPDPFATAGQAQPLAPGVYHTDINVHNASGPGTTAQPNTVFIQKKVVVTPLDQINPAPQQFEIVGNPTLRERLSMRDDQAFEVDCAAIFALIQQQLQPGQPNPCAASSSNPVPFCKGYVVIEGASQLLGSTFLSPAQLDVTNVVTLSSNGNAGTPGGPVSLDFEYVTGKRISYPCWSNTSPLCPP